MKISRARIELPRPSLSGYRPPAPGYRSVTLGVRRSNPGRVSFYLKKTIRTGYRWPTGEVGRRERAPKGQCTRSRRLPHSLRPSAAIALPLFITSFLSWDNIGGEEVKSYYPARTAVASLISLLNMASLLLVILLRNFPYEMRSRNRKVAGLPLFFLLSECVCLCVRRPVGGTAGRINDPDRSRFHFQ